MKHISIGGLDVSRIGLGAMSMSGYYNIGTGSDDVVVATKFGIVSHSGGGPGVLDSRPANIRDKMRSSVHCSVRA